MDKKENLDFFKTNGNDSYAGDHLIIDFWGAEPLNDIPTMKKAMIEAVEVSGATLLHIHLHHFSSTGGISGVAVLAESHISVHTWPEKKYAAFDIFMCGNAEPKKALLALEKALSPQKTKLTKIERGLESLPY
jgi:S-adenosylmethionine decarboxylase